MAGPWEKYQQSSAPKAGPWQQYAKPARTMEERYVAAGIDPNEYSPAEGGMSDFAAGFGQSFVNAGRGLKQLATERLRDISRGDILGIIPEGALPENAVSRFAKRSLAEQQAKIDEARRLDQPLSGHLLSAGGAGNVAGNITQLLVPGMALRGTMVGRALLPTTIRGNALQGAVLGYLQPTATGESRNVNAAIGGMVGAAIPAVVKGAGNIRSTVTAAMRPEQQAAQEAVRTIQREAVNPTVGMVANPSAIPNVTRSLFEETLDPGIARLETRARGTGTGFTERDSANNLARMAALRDFAGDEASLAAAEEARSAGTRQLRNHAFNEADTIANQAAKAGFSPAGNIASLRKQFADIASGQGGRSAVKRTVQDVIADLDDAAPTAQGLYNVRKSINDLIEGKAGSEKSYARAATAELMQMRDAVDAELANLAPGFEAYRGAFQNLSGPINRQQIGQELIRRTTLANPDAAAGELILAPAQFNRQARGLDRLAQSATGFDKAKAADILEPSDLATINAISDDLSRRAARLPLGSGGGSHTASQTELGKRITLRGLARATPWAGDVVKFLDEQNAQRLEKAVERVLMNPNEYRVIAELMKKDDRRIFEDALKRVASLGANTIKWQQNQPIDISGGRIATPEEMAADSALVEQFRRR